MKASKLVIISSVILGIASMSSCSNAPKESNKNKIVKLAVAEPANKQFSLEYPGKVKAAEDVNLSFRVSGVIDKIYVKQGDYVKKGQRLAELDSTDYAIQLEATYAQYLQVKGEAERVIALYKEGGTTPNNYDKAVYGLEQITAKYRHHKDQLLYTKLYAPFAGKVQSIVFSEFETVGAGMPIITMMGSKDLEVEINIPAAEYIRKEQFTNYSCTFNYYPNKVFKLEPISIAPNANANQLYTIRLKLDAQKDTRITPGMVTMVKIDIGDDSAAQLIQVPKSAIFVQDQTSYVFVYSSNTKTVSKKAVNMVQLMSNGQCVVTSEQLQKGDSVVALGVRYLEDGDKVQPLEVNSSTNIGGLL